MHKLLLFSLIPAFIWAQSFYESSGLTSVFTLKAGAKTNPVAVKATASPPPTTSFRIAYLGNRLKVSGSYHGIVKIFRLNGRMVGAYILDRSGIATLSAPLSTDVYLIRLETNGESIQTARLVVFAGGSR